MMLPSSGGRAKARTPPILKGGMRMRAALHSRNTRRIAPYLFVLPFLLALVFVYAYPLAETVLMSFQKVKLLGASKWVGLKNHQNLLQPQFLAAIKNSFVYTFFILLTEVPLALLLALALNRTTLHGRNALRSIFFVPLLTSAFIGCVLFRFIFGASATSLFYSLLMILGLVNEPINWLFSSEGRGILVLVMVSMWRTTGLNRVFFLSALQGMTLDLYDAARILSAPCSLLWIRISPLRYLPGKPHSCDRCQTICTVI